MSNYSPSDFSKQFSQAKQRQEYGDFSAARIIYETILQSNPLQELALYGLAQTLQLQQRSTEALSILQQLIKINPAHDSGYALLAEIYATEGQSQAALRYYQKAIQIKPDYAAAFLGAGIVLYRVGEIGKGLQAVSQALKLQPDLPKAHQNMALMLRYLSLSDYQPELAKDITACFAAVDVDHQLLAELTAEQLLHKHQFNSTEVLTGEILQNLSVAMNGDPLWRDFLTKTINTSPQMELLLTQVRRAILLNYKNEFMLPDNRLALIAALGLQCFSNEYVFAVSTEEQQILNLLREKKIYRKKTNADLNSPLLLCAMYYPLHQLTGEIEFSAEQTLVNELIIRTYRDIHQEEILRLKIPSFSRERDLVSQKVRAQYEENPYPRWKAPPASKSLPVNHLLRGLPGFRSQEFSPGTSGNIEVLVAGCGTGFEPLELARMDTSLNITAIDLSKSSLAYGMRIAQQLAVTNVRFLQGDILEVNDLNKQFDLVTSTGVLHHMADPKAGWGALYGVTKPGGVMRISLYSEHARRRIVSARQRISELKLSASAEDIKTFRAEILNKSVVNVSEERELSELLESDDFYTLSACRDLLFHVQEHRFTFPQIATLISDLGLRFIGLDVPHNVRAEFARRFPGEVALLDLQKWNEFEEALPDTFAGMYQLWCQKPG